MASYDAKSVVVVFSMLGKVSYLLWAMTAVLSWHAVSESIKFNKGVHEAYCIVNGVFSGMLG